MRPYCYRLVAEMISLLFFLVYECIYMPGSEYDPVSKMLYPLHTIPPRKLLEVGRFGRFAPEADSTDATRSSFFISGADVDIISCSPGTPFYRCVQSCA